MAIRTFPIRVLTASRSLSIPLAGVICLTAGTVSGRTAAAQEAPHESARFDHESNAPVALPPPPIRSGEFDAGMDSVQVGLQVDPAEVGRIDASPRVRLIGIVRPEATLRNDLGQVYDSLPMEHVLLQLQASAARQQAAAEYLSELSDKSSPNYHRWLSAEEFGRRFGPAQQDVDRVAAWLALHGLVVQAVYPSRMTIDFSGTAGEIREAFQTEMHAYDVDGQRHIANATDPAVPATLSAVIVGIVSLHDFRPRPMLVSRVSPGGRAPQPGASNEIVNYPVTASDLATIYNLTPLFKAGYTGKGQTIALIEDSDIHSSADWTAFRNAFGISAYAAGSLSQVHPRLLRGANNCADPGAITGWDEEPILDAEYASASAPGAAIELATCASTSATDGTLIALVNLVNAPGVHPSVLSVSYGTCEAANGAAANAAIASAYQLAVSEGISVFAATGDGGASFCDVGATVATHGIGVNAYASTPYNVAVGGTDFADTYLHTNSSYWGKANPANGSTVRSYVPETPWNDSCANPLIASWNGYKTTYGFSGFCWRDFEGLDAYQTTIAGGGGPSGCATGSPLLGYVVSGSCRGFAKPSWQSALGNPRDGARDLPDVALFAADGIWGHYFLFCDSNVNDPDGAPCKSGQAANWSQGGGTSFAAPVMAGIQALVNQKWGRQGNPNPMYYKLAAAQFMSGTLKTTCSSANGASSGSNCIFHDVAAGASDVNCFGVFNCYANVLATSSFSFVPAYSAQAGWDFGTGLGSVNAYNLVMSTSW